MIINEEMLKALQGQAEESERGRMNHDLRTTADEGSQRMLNALQPGTQVPIHRHPHSSETVVVLSGRVTEVFFEEVDGQLRETGRYDLCPAEGRYGIQIPLGVWHTVVVNEPCVIFEAKDGRYSADGSEVR